MIQIFAPLAQELCTLDCGSKLRAIRLSKFGVCLGSLDTYKMFLEALSSLQVNLFKHDLLDLPTTTRIWERLAWWEPSIDSVEQRDIKTIEQSKAQRGRTC